MSQSAEHSIKMTESIYKVEQLKQWMSKASGWTKKNTKQAKILEKCMINPNTFSLSSLSSLPHLKLTPSKVVFPPGIDPGTPRKPIHWPPMPSPACDPARPAIPYVYYRPCIDDVVGLYISYRVVLWDSVLIISIFGFFKPSKSDEKKMSATNSDQNRIRLQQIMLDAPSVKCTVSTCTLTKWMWRVWWSGIGTFLIRRFNIGQIF